MRYHLTSVRMSIIKNKRDNKCWQGNTVYCWRDSKLIQPLWKKNPELLKKFKYTTYDSAILLWVYIQRKQNHNLDDGCVLMFTATLFIVTTVQKQLVSINGWTDQELIMKYQYYSALKKEILSFVTTRIELERLCWVK